MDSRRLAPALLCAAALAAAPAAAQQAGGAHDVPVIEVSASGDATAAPDRAWVDLGVETEGATAAEAASRNAQTMERVIAALVRAGVERDDVRTSNYMVMPRYAQGPDPRGGEPRVVGYAVVNTVTAETGRVREVGRLIDAGLEAGANRVHGVRFGVEDPTRLRAEALREAVARSRVEAEAIASALGGGLGPVVAVRTDSNRMPFPVPVARMEMAQDAAATPIEPGEQTVSAQVFVVYRFHP